jgi:hypothetical protein
LIKAERRSVRNENGRAATGNWMSMTENGRAWAAENLAAQPAKSQAAAPILQAWLARLSGFLHARDIPLTEFFGISNPTREPRPGLTVASGVPPRPTSSAQGRNYDALSALVRKAYLDVTGNRINTRARLSHIRQKLNDVDRSALDEALKRMQREQQVALYPLDNKTEITDEDRTAAIYFGSEPRHILWIER